MRGASSERADVKDVLRVVHEIVSEYESASMDTKISYQRLSKALGRCPARFNNRVESHLDALSCVSHYVMIVSLAWVHAAQNMS